MDFGFIGTVRHSFTFGGQTEGCHPLGVLPFLKKYLRSVVLHQIYNQTLPKYSLARFIQETGDLSGLVDEVRQRKSSFFHNPSGLSINDAIKVDNPSGLNL